MAPTLIYRPKPNHAPGPVMAPGPEWIADFQARADLVDTWNILLGSKTLLDAYDIQAGRALVDAYTIRAGAILIDVFDIERAVYKSLVDNYRIAAGPVALEDSYDIQAGAALEDVYKILIRPSLIDLYNIAIGAKSLIDQYRINIGQSLVDNYDIQITMDAGLVDRYDIQVGTKSLIDHYIIFVGARLVDHFDIEAPEWGYWMIGSYNFAGRLRREPKPGFSGYDPQTSEWAVVGRRDLEMHDTGRKPLTWSGRLQFIDEATDQEFRSACAGLDRDFQLFLGSSGRQYFGRTIKIIPAWTIHDFDLHAMYDVAIEMEEPYAFSGIGLGSSWNPGAVTVPAESDVFEHVGEADAEIYSASIQAVYSLGHPTDIYLSVLDESDVVYGVLEIADRLLSDEVAVIDRRQRYITFTYTDDYASSTKFGRDATQSGCSVSGGKVSVPSGAWFYYRFQGPHPQVASEAIKLTAKINVVAGSPIIQVSTNGTTWTTAVSAAEIAAGSGKTVDYRLAGTPLQSDIYLRFYSPSGSSMTVEDVEFESKRDIQGGDWMGTPAGEKRKVKITGGTGSRVIPQIVLKSKYYP